MIYLLKKSLYGLKQSPRQWHLRLDEFILSHGYNISKYDSYIYYRSLFSSDVIYLLLFTDDMLIACTHRIEIKKMKAKLSVKFEIQDLGLITRILGIKIRRDRHARTLLLTQVGYVKKVLNKFGMDNSKYVSTLLAVHFKLFKQ